MATLKSIEGIGEKNAAKLEKAGIKGTSQFMFKAETPSGRKEMAEDSGISEKLILEWANHIDLFRVTGIGPEYADLLEAAGVDTVAELAQRNAANLAETLEKVNNKKKLVRALPTEPRIKEWIAEAKKLPRVLQY